MKMQALTDIEIYAMKQRILLKLNAGDKLTPQEEFIYLVHIVGCSEEEAEAMLANPSGGDNGEKVNY